MVKRCKNQAGNGTGQEWGTILLVREELRETAGLKPQPGIQAASAKAQS
jgi:hypothetical protein